MSEKTYAYFRKDAFVPEGRSVFCHVDPGYVKKTKRILFDDRSASEVPTDAVRIDEDYATPDAAHRIYGWLTDDGTMHVWTNADVIRLTDKDTRCLYSHMKETEEIDLSRIDTSEVTDMSYMFASCSGLKALDLSQFDTSRVTDMSYMFSGCSKLKSLDVSSFDTSKVTGMSLMFQGCKSLTILNVSSFDTSKATDMSFMFSGCSRLKSLDLSSFDTSQVPYMSYMFAGCSKLASLDISSFDVSDETAMNEAFLRCGKLKEITVSDRWKRTSGVSGVSLVRNAPAKRHRAPRREDLER